MPQHAFRGSELVYAATGGATGAMARLLLSEWHFGTKHDVPTSLVAIILSGLLFGAVSTVGYRSSSLRWLAIGFCSGLGALSVTVMVATTSSDVWLSGAYLITALFSATGALAAGQLLARLGTR